MKVEMKGFIVNATAKVDASSEIVRRIQLEVHGDMAAIQELMKEPLIITLEVMQPKFGDNLPQRGKKAKAPKGA